MLFAPRFPRQENGRDFCDREGAKSLSVFRERRQVYTPRPSSFVPRRWDRVSYKKQTDERPSRLKQAGFARP